jgi:predicted flap endonuclease-1-like 5' DNA nuclease
MAYSLIHIHGIGPVHQTALSRHNIRNTDHLLHVTREPGPRRRLSEDTGIPESELRKWREFVRLLRVPGVGPTYARLLAETGVGSIGALASADPVQLTARLGIACAKERVRGPSPANVNRWIGEARTLVEGVAPR